MCDFPRALVVAKADCFDVLQAMYLRDGTHLKHRCFWSCFHQQQQFGETTRTYVRFQFRFAGPVFLKTECLRITDFLVDPASKVPAFHLSLHRDAAKSFDRLNRTLRLRGHSQTELEHVLK
jgi:hypothetical protein